MLKLQVPTIKLFEQAICNRYYSTQQQAAPNIDEGLCKVPSIQNQLATVRYAFCPKISFSDLILCPETCLKKFLLVRRVSELTCLPQKKNTDSDIR